MQIAVAEQDDLTEVEPVGVYEVDSRSLAEAMIVCSTPHLFGEPWEHPNAAPVAARSRQVLKAL